MALALALSCVGTACSSSSSAHAPATTVVNGSIGDPTTPEWMHDLDWVDRGGAIVRATSQEGRGGSEVRMPLAPDQRRAPLFAHVTIWGAGPFVINELDATGAASSLLSRDGPYDGTTVVNSDGTTVALSVRAAGRWSIRLSDLRRAPSFSTQIRGVGDGVVVYRGRGSTVTSTFRGNSDFTAMYYGRAGTEDLTGDEFGNYSADAPVGPGAAVITVQSAGIWSLTAH